MSERFYVNCPLAPGEAALTGPEAHHLAVVCRLRPGDAVCLFNGDGHEYPARVRSVDRRQVVVTLQIVESPARELGFRLEAAVPLPKGDRAQILVEKLTELGATALVPLRTKRSVVHPRESKVEKLERWVIEASKQCGRNVLMAVRPLTDWETYCRSEELPRRRILAHPGEGGDKEARRQGDKETSDIVLAVGPEGGFTDEEVQWARHAGWQVVGLGPRTLRVETAALVLAARFSATTPRAAENDGSYTPRGKN